MTERGPSKLRVRLGAELRRIRGLAGHSQDSLGLPQSTVSRVELGRRLPTREQAERWLVHSGAEDRATATVLLDAAHRETRTWTELLDGQQHLQDEARDRTAAARRLRAFAPTVIPGLLQTAAYSRRVLELGRTDVASALAARIEGQHVLYESGRRFEFLLSEDVLRCAVAPDARAAQLHQLVTVATLESVQLGVVPAERVDCLAWSNFVIRDPADDSPPYVAVELIHGQQLVEDPESVAAYVGAWDALWSGAVVGDEAATLIRTT